MSVGGVDKGRSTEVDARNRQEASRKEADQAKRHANEINRLRQEHYEKMQELQQIQQKALDDQRQSYSSAMTERDLQYQKEVEELREMNRQKLMSTAASYEDKLGRAREANQSDVAAQKKINEQQRKVLTETFSSELSTKEKNFREAIERTKQMQSEGMTRDREGMLAKHKQEQALMREAFNSDVESLNDQNRSLRISKAQQEDDLKTEIFKTKNNMSDQFQYQLTRERKVNNDQASMNKQAFDMALDNQRDRYREALEAERARSEYNNEGFRKGAGGRLQDRVSQLERKLVEERNKSSDKMIETKRLNDLEKSHTLDNVRANLEASERQRQLALEDSQNRTANEVKRMADQNAKALHAMDMNAKEAAAMDHVKAEDEKSQLEIQWRTQHEKLKADSDIRHKKLVSVFDQERQAMADSLQDQLSAMRKNYDESLLQVRVEGQKERNAILERVQKQMQAQDQKAMERLQLQSTGYERKLAEMRTTHNREMDSVRRDYDTRIKNNQALSEQELANQKLKYETQLAQQKENYEKKLHEQRQAFEVERLGAAKVKT